MRSARKLVFSLSWLAVVAAAVSLGASCKRATLEDAPDANVDCRPGAHVFCDPDASVGCDVAPNDPNPRLAKLAPGRYGTGCVANFVSDNRDVGGDCVVEAVCRCNEPSSGTGGAVDGGTPPHWTCFP